jgi:Arc/MetJ-type ribon-helix-helix transcriptional regulator
MPSKMKQLTVWLPGELKEEFREWCEEEDYRSMGEAVRWWVRWAVRERRERKAAEETEGGAR